MSDTQRERHLFITLSNIGDAVMTLPALEAYHAAFRRDKIDIVADARSSMLFSQVAYRGDVFLKDKQAGGRGTWQLLRQLRRRRYRSVVDLRSLVLPWLLRKRRAATKLGIQPGGEHAVHEHLAVVETLLERRLGVPLAPVAIGDEARAEAAGLVAPLGGGRLLARAPGANWEAKVWPVERYAALVRHLSGQFDAVVALGGPDDREAVASLAAVSPLPVLDLAGTIDLLTAAAVLTHAAYFVGNDSGVGHIAAAMGRPTMTVFGPGQPERYRPWGALARWIVAPDGNIASVSADEVAAAVHDQLATLTPVISE
ncbi:MAG: glycosyltransferase family 9 protein [Gammaproteobacteria bacterium]|nr:glycosyltransferase family 9 protein [Gammaproteobacteria bacterium]